MSERQPHELAERPQSRREWSGWLRSVVLPLALVTAIVASLLYLQGGDDAGGDGAYGTVALPAGLNPTGESPAAREGRVAPDFRLETLAGGELRFSDLRGTPVIVNFFTTWCTTCRREMPDFVTFYEQQREAGVTVLAIDLQESAGLVSRYVEEFGITFPVVLDRSGEVGRTWQIGGPSEGVPSTYFVDGEGVVRKVIFGLVRPEDLAEGLDLITRVE